jgi:hypothetical protein
MTLLLNAGLEFINLFNQTLTQIVKYFIFGAVQKTYSVIIYAYISKTNL